MIFLIGWTHGDDESCSPGVFISQLNREAAVWARQPDRHADGIEAVTHSSHCQNQVAAVIRSQVCVEDEKRRLLCLFIFEEGYPGFSSWSLEKASIMRLDAALLVFCWFFLNVASALRASSVGLHLDQTTRRSTNQGAHRLPHCASPSNYCCRLNRRKPLPSSDSPSTVCPLSLILWIRSKLSDS